MSEIQLKAINTDVVDIEVQESDNVSREIETIVVKDQLSYERIANIRKVSNNKAKELDAQRKEITVPLDEAKKRIMTLFKKPVGIYRNILSICDKKMITYTEIQEKKRKEEQDKLDRLAEKKRLEAEAKAEKAREEGKEDKAERYEEKAAEVMAPIAAPRVEKAEGVSYIERWNGEVIDKSILPREYMIPDQSKINKVISATKGTLPIPGVKINKTRTVSTRA